MLAHYVQRGRRVYFRRSGERLVFPSLLVLVFATMLASAGASAFNHYFDMDIDALMPRTKARPIPSGGVADGKVVLALAVILLAISLAVSSLWLNYMVGLHLLLGALTYAILYTAWLKRKSWVNIIIGGLAGSFAVLAGGLRRRPSYARRRFSWR